MNKSICWIIPLLIMLGVGLLSCTDSFREGSGEVPSDIDMAKDKEVAVVLNIDVPYSKDIQDDLRAISADDEKKIESLRVLMFKVEEGSPTIETFSYEASVMRHDNNQATVLLKTSESGERYRAVLLANVDHAGSNIAEGMSKEKILSRLTFEVDGKWNTKSHEDFTALPMWGESEAEIIVGASVAKPFEKTIQLLRAVARVDVGLCLEGEKFDETANPGKLSGVTGFTLSRVYVHNSNTKGNVAKLNSVISEPSLPSGELTKTNRLEYPVSNNLSLREIYLAEAANYATLDHTERPFLVIEGIYNGKPTFYRIDYLKKTVDPSGKVTYEYLPLLRNHRYKINITSIRGKGFDTEEEAAKSTAANIDYNVTVWNESEVTKVVYDGQYMLGVSKDNLIYYNHTYTKNVIVRTSWPQGWTATVTKGKDWITITTDKGQVDTDVIMGISVIENNADDAVERHGVITITAGRMTWNVNVKQLNESEVSLEIYEFEADGKTLKPEPISLLHFTGKGGTKKIAVKCSPSTDSYNSQGEGYSGPVNLTLNDFVFEKLANEISEDMAVYNVKVNPMSDPNNYFESITGVTNFTIKSDGKSVSKTLILMQTEYNAIPYESIDFSKMIQFVETPKGGTPIIRAGTIPFFLMDGKPGDNFVIKANTRYNIKMISTTNKPKKNINHNQGLKLIELGFPLNDEVLERRGKFAGEVLGFTTANDLEEPKRFYGQVEFEITSPDGLFEPRTFKLLIASGIIQPEANTYLMKPGHIGIIIPVSQIDKAAEYYNGFKNEFEPYINQSGKNLEGRTWEKNFELPTLDKSEPWTVEVLWAEVMNTYPNNQPVVSKTGPNDGVLYILTEAGKDYIFVMPSYNHTGNVIIGLKQGNNIMWSWHLWLVDTYPSEKPITNGGISWLDRDLGAFGVTVKTNGRFDNKLYEQHGLLYQWGRKDPFPLLKISDKSVFDGTATAKRNTKLINAEGKDYYTDFTTATKHVRTVGTMKEMINNPTVYYSIAGQKDTSPFLELPNGTSSFTVNRAYAALWGGVALLSSDITFGTTIASTTKTPFDPSPYGWKVPNSGSEANWGTYRPKISTVDGTSDFYKQESSSVSFPNMSAGDSESFRWTSTRMTNNVRGRYIYGTGNNPKPADNSAHSTSAGIMVRSVRNEWEQDYDRYLPKEKVKP